MFPSFGAMKKRRLARVLRFLLGQTLLFARIGPWKGLTTTNEDTFMCMKVTLTASDENDFERRFTYEGRANVVVGRSDDCGIQICAGGAVSRQHCEFEIEPPSVRVRDLGSLNGTFVNGRSIGQRSRRDRAPDADHAARPSRDLRDGDEVRVGFTVIRVGILAPVEVLLAV
jgi:pSer/pThr/pTyr-binding forkhead associated (FHA) protein